MKDQEATRDEYPVLFEYEIPADWEKYTSSPADMPCRVRLIDIGREGLASVECEEKVTCNEWHSNGDADKWTARALWTELERVMAENAKLKADDTYPHAARVIALHLAEFCDKSLTYPDMIAEAARRAKAALDELRAELDALKAALPKTADLQVIVPGIMLFKDDDLKEERLTGKTAKAYEVNFVWGDGSVSLFQGGGEWHRSRLYARHPETGEPADKGVDK